MPVLRMPADNTLGDTLGNLGRSLAEGLNPMNQIRAQDMLAQMRQREWEIRQKQMLDAANANAAEVYRNANPHNLSQADLEVAVAQIRNGQYNASQTIEALKAAGGYAAAQAAAGLVDAQHPEWSPAQRASAKQQILSGKSLSEVEQNYATAANETNKATATIAGTNAAQTPAAKEAAAIGQPETATKLDTQNKLLTAPPITGPLSDATTQQAIDQRTIERGVAGVPVTADAPVSIAEGPNIKAANTSATTTAANTADNATKPRGNLYPGPGGFGSGPSQPAQPAQPPAPSSNGPTPPAQSSPPAPATVTVPNPSAPFTVPTTVSRTLPDGSTLMGPTATETATNDATNKARADTLNQAMDEGATAARMKVKLAQIRDLETVSSTGGAGGQVAAAAMKRLADAGIVVGDQASAYKAIDQILNTEIPDLRKASGIQRLAGPEIQAVGKQIGTANLPPGVLNNIIANEEAAADTQIARRNNAQNTLGIGDQPMTYTDYTNADNDLNNSLKQRTDALRQQYDAIGTQTQQPPPIAQPGPPALGSGSIWDAVSHLFGGGPPAPAPQPPSPPVQAPPSGGFQFDPKTNSIVPVQ